MSFNHGEGCRCVICSGEMKRRVPADRKEKQLVEKLGWFYHVVCADPFVATGFNFHTHGFDLSLGGHLDLQIVFPMSENKARAIAKTIYDQIRSDGKGFRDGDETEILHEDGSKYPVRFIKVREGDREVLRVILPNPRGGLEPDQVAESDEPEYALQWTVLAV